MQRKDFTDPFGGKPGVFFFTSSHLETQMLFRNDNDFKYGVNSLAACLIGSSCSLLCYCLMSNHMHLLLYGTYKNCLAYYDHLIKRLSMWLSKERGITGLLRHNDVDIQAITDVRQLRNVALYTIRNPYRARVASPLSYKWSSADVYFNNTHNLEYGQVLSDLPVLEVRRLLANKARCPKTYRMHDGVVLNQCFVDHKRVEKAFGDALTFYDSLRVYDLESAVKLSFGRAESITFTDQQLMEFTKTICEKEFHVESVAQLDKKARFLLARKLSRRYGAGKKQLSRLTGITQEDLDRLL